MKSNKLLKRISSILMAGVLLLSVNLVSCAGEKPEREFTGTAGVVVNAFRKLRSATYFKMLEDDDEFEVFHDPSRGAYYTVYTDRYTVHTTTLNDEPYSYVKTSYTECYRPAKGKIVYMHEIYSNGDEALVSRRSNVDLTLEALCGFHYLNVDRIAPYAGGFLSSDCVDKLGDVIDKRRDASVTETEDGGKEVAIPMTNAQFRSVYNAEGLYGLDTESVMKIRIDADGYPVKMSIFWEEGADFLAESDREYSFTVTDINAKSGVTEPEWMKDPDKDEVPPAYLERTDQYAAYFIEVSDDPESLWEANRGFAGRILLATIYPINEKKLSLLEIPKKVNGRLVSVLDAGNLPAIMEDGGKIILPDGDPELLFFIYGENAAYDFYRFYTQARRPAEGKLADAERIYFKGEWEMKDGVPTPVEKAP